MERKNTAVQYLWLSAVMAALFFSAGCGGNGEGEDAAEDREGEQDAVQEGDEGEPDARSDAPGEDGAGDQVEEDAAEEELPPELAWGPCDTTNWPDGYPLPAAGVECTLIDVPFDYDDPGAGTVTLTVARHKSRAFPTGRAIFNLAGGPGGTSVGQSGTIPIYMPDARDDFDLVYVDQRGTGGSGYMDCPGGYPETEAEWEACAGAYGDVDLNHYLTVDAAHDLNFVRRRLGYDRIYIRGGSYGTRLGLEYIRQHGDTVVAAVLDGLAPPDIDLFGESVHAFDHGVELLAADCSADAACLAVCPDVVADLMARREALRASPRPILVDGVGTVEDEEVYLMFLEAFLYYSMWRYRVPRAVHAALGGDNSLWNRMMSEAYGGTITDASRSHGADRCAPDFPMKIRPKKPITLGRDYVAPGLFITVVCAEWFPNSGGLDALRAMAAAQTWGGQTYVDLAQACAAWKVRPIDASLRQAVTSDLPVLLMSGEIDLNTYREWGDHAAETLPDGTHVVVPYATHSTISVECASRIMVQFLRSDGQMSSVDTSCIDSLTPPAW
jgi:pimeloyl-ACP methyl ester carboxylesterase